MWNVQMYEMLANERMAALRREAAADRLGLDTAAGGRTAGRKEARMARLLKDTAPDPATRSGRLGLAAMLVGLAAAGALRRRR